LTSLAYPVADVVLLALLVAVGAILGLRRDRTLILLAPPSGARSSATSSSSTWPPGSSTWKAAGWT
ncbi:MAG: hypothetical protein ACLGI3_00790, partial [Actinomycetes bacterium]